MGGEERAEFFSGEFVFFLNYYSNIDEYFMGFKNYQELKQENHFVDRIYELLEELSDKLTFPVLQDAIDLVYAELKKHKLSKKLGPCILIKLYAFLKRVRQSERDYFDNKDKEKKQREIEQKEREKEREMRRLRDKGLLTPSPEPDDTSSVMACGRKTPISLKIDDEYL